jgi:hypothetical protein
MTHAEALQKTNLTQRKYARIKKVPFWSKELANWRKQYQTAWGETPIADKISKLGIYLERLKIDENNNKNEILAVEKEIEKIGSEAR